MQPGIIIILNGTSSAGKSTIALELQKVSATPYVHLSVDAFMHMLPARYTDDTPPPDHPEVLRNVIRGFHASIAAMAGMGNHLIVDHVLQYQSLVADCFAHLQGLQVYLIGIHCPLEELNRREQQRGDRAPGLAATQLPLVHSYIKYDFELDSSKLSPETCAARINDYIASHPSPTAFAS